MTIFSKFHSQTHQPVVILVLYFCRPNTLHQAAKNYQSLQDCAAIKETFQKA